MNRSIWKIPRMLMNHSKYKTYFRSAVIAPRNIGSTFKIHNGCRFIPIRITEHHVGYKIGSFSQTRKTVYHKRKGNKR